MPQGPLDRLREFLRYQSPAGAKSPVTEPAGLLWEFLAEGSNYFLVCANQFNLGHQFHLAESHDPPVSFGNANANHRRLADAPWPLLSLGQK